ncbi:MAG: PIG-L family deacetylase [Streptosporangiaceae bacterium]|nr:PIG-L family deacetylase [Streptosporangiaceae bacterium]
MTGTAHGGAANLIDGPGTSETRWRRWPGLLASPVLNVTRWVSAVIVAAHPDDEVLGAGGVMSVLAATGARLRVIAVTDGEASHPGHRDTAELVRRRAQERAEALRALGATDAEVIRLGLPDSGLAALDSQITAAFEDLVTGFEVCLAPWESDLHADHEAVGRAARQAGKQTFFYPVWMWHWARPAAPSVPWGQAVRVVLPPAVAARKQAAIRCFRSQLKPRAPGAPPVLPPGFVTHFCRDYEVLFPVVRL